MVIRAKVCELTDGFLWFACGLYVGILMSPLTLLFHHLSDIILFRMIVWDCASQLKNTCLCTDLALNYLKFTIPVLPIYICQKGRRCLCFRWILC